MLESRTQILSTSPSSPLLLILFFSLASVRPYWEGTWPGRYLIIWPPFQPTMEARPLPLHLYNLPFSLKPTCNPSHLTTFHLNVARTALIWPGLTMGARSPNGGSSGLSPAHELALEPRNSGGILIYLLSNLTSDWSTVRITQIRNAFSLYLTQWARPQPTATPPLKSARLDYLWVSAFPQKCKLNMHHSLELKCFEWTRKHQNDTWKQPFISVNDPAIHNPPQPPTIKIKMPTTMNNWVHQMKFQLTIKFHMFICTNCLRQNLLIDHIVAAVVISVVNKCVFMDLETMATSDSVAIFLWFCKMHFSGGIFSCQQVCVYGCGDYGCCWSWLR